MSTETVKKILFLGANPKDTTRLRLDEEIREIDQALRLASKRDQFELVQKWAVTPKDAQRAILDLSPAIVHFSGHGVGQAANPDPGGAEKTPSASSDRRKATVVSGNAKKEPEGLVFEDESGNVKLVGAAAIAGLFELFADQIECVLLNACYSEAQAKAIVQHIPYVIGMKRAIGDNAAREFAVGFYDALGAGRDVEFAFKFACNSISMAGIPEDLTPVIKRKSDLQPLPPVPSEKPDVTVEAESKFYIASPYEDRCYEEIEKPGSLIRIKSPDKMGKSSLTARVLNHAEQLGYRTVMIDLDLTNQKFFADQDKFNQWFCASVGKPLGIRVKLEDYWDDIFGPNDNSTDYFEKYLLKAEDPPLVLALDSFDRIFEYDLIEPDFCALLRGWYERSKYKKQWEKLRLIIVHSRESYAKRDINQSPFNVGLPIELGEFTLDQVRELVVRHELKWSDAEFKKFTNLIGGHPYMVRVGLYKIAAGDLTLETFLKTAPTEAGIFSDLLRGFLSTLEGSPDLRAAMKKVVESDEPVDLRADDSFKLDSMGLVVRVQNAVIPRCLLYRQYFRKRLADA